MKMKMPTKDGGYTVVEMHQTDDRTIYPFPNENWDIVDTRYKAALKTEIMVHGCICVPDRPWVEEWSTMLALLLDGSQDHHDNFIHAVADDLRNRATEV